MYIILHNIAKALRGPDFPLDVTLLAHSLPLFNSTNFT
nr:unnamed protein product [Callosobruchus analis]